MLLKKIITLSLFFAIASCSNGDGETTTTSTSTSGSGSSDAPTISVIRNSKTLSTGSAIINMGTVVSGGSGNSATISITNSGGTDLIISNVSITGADPNDFTTDFNSDITIASGESHDLVITFSPATTTTGGRSADLRITHNDDSSENPFYIQLTGSVTSTLPRITIRSSSNNLFLNGSSSINFGSITEGTAATAQTITITNQGSEDLTISAPATAAPFTTTTPGSTTIAPGALTTFNVNFSPGMGTLGFQSNTISISNNDPNANPFIFTVTGTSLSSTTVIKPEIMVTVNNTGTTDGAIHNFGTVRVNPANSPSSATKTVRIYNTGNANLTINSITALAGHFSKTVHGTTIAPGGFTSFVVTYDPTGISSSANDHDLTLTIDSNDPDAADALYNLVLRGYGTDPLISYDAYAVGFGDTQSGTVNGAPKTITIRNNGNIALPISSITASGATTQFTNTTLTTPIAAGGSATFVVNHVPNAQPSPATSVPQTITYTIISSDASVANLVLPAFTGICHIHNIETSDNTLSFSNIDIGDATAASIGTFDIINNSTALANLNITGIAALGGEDPGDFLITGGNTGTPFNINFASTETYTIDFTPTPPYVDGTRSATITFTSNDPESPTHVVTITATVNTPTIATPSIAPAAPATTLGKSTVLTLTLNNGATGPIRISNVTIDPTSTYADEFTINNPGSFPIDIVNSGSNNTLQVIFSPQDRNPDVLEASPRILKLLIEDDDTNTANNAAIFTLSGISVSYPDISIPGGPIAFGSVNLSTSSILPFTITNNGSAPLTVNGSITAGAAQYSIVAVPSAPIAGTGGTANISVQYTPNGADGVNQAGTLQITSDDPTQAQKALDVTLSGNTNLYATCGITPSGPIDFGIINEGTSSATQQITITNNGNTDLNVTSIALDAANVDFAVGSLSPAGAIAASGGTATFTVQYTPQSGITHTGTVRIQSNDGTATPISDVTLSLAGAVNVANINITATPTFPLTLKGDTSTVQTVTINNNGSTPLIIYSGTIIGSHAADYDITPASLAAFPLTINAAASANITLTFSPTGLGNRDGTLLFVSNDTSLPADTVTLTGNANDIIDDSTNAGQYTSIDTDGSTIAVSYHDIDIDRVKVALSFDDGQSFAITAVDTTALTDDRGKYSRIKLNDSGNDIYLAYYDETNANLLFMRSANNGSTWTGPTIVDGNAPVESLGNYIAMDALGAEVFISYNDTTNSRVKLAYSSNNGSTWSLHQVAPETCNGSSIIYDIANSYVHIAYYENTANQDLKYARAGTGDLNTWTVLTIDNSADDQGLYPSMTVQSPNIGISYYDSTNGRLLYAQSTNNGNGGSWTSASVIDNSATIVGNFGSVLFHTLSSKALFAYYNQSDGQLKFTRSNYDGSSPDIDTIDSTSDRGQYVSIAAFNSDIYVVYYDNTSGNLMIIKSEDSGISW